MIYEYWLAGIKEITDLKKQKLREVYGSGKAIYYIEETKLDKLRFLNEKDVAILKNAKKDTELEEKWRRTEEKRIQFIPYFLKTYPKKLLPILRMHYMYSDNFRMKKEKVRRL